MKIRPVGAELFHADGQTYMMKLTVAFRNFAKAPYVHVIAAAASTFSHPTNGTRAGGRKWVVKDGVRDGDRR